MTFVELPPTEAVLPSSAVDGLAARLVLLDRLRRLLVEPTFAVSEMRPDGSEGPAVDLWAL